MLGVPISWVENYSQTLMILENCWAAPLMMTMAEMECSIFSVICSFRPLPEEPTVIVKVPPIYAFITRRKGKASLRDFSFAYWSRGNVIWRSFILHSAIVRVGICAGLPRSETGAVNWHPWWKLVGSAVIMTQNLGRYLASARLRFTV